MIQHKNSPSLDEECFLVSEEPDFDEIGNEISRKTETSAYCGELPIYQNEYFKAAQQDIQAERILVVNSIDYTEQRKVRYQGTVFDIYRIYARPDELTELYLKKGAAQDESG